MIAAELTLPDVTRRPSGEVRALQDCQLWHTVELLYDAHSYYGQLMPQHGLEPRNLATCDDLGPADLSRASALS
jgi:phenylacetate-coenzyme A ligase PaaK-like adenylate-forming protein